MAMNLPPGIAENCKPVVHFSGGTTGKSSPADNTISAAVKSERKTSLQEAVMKKFSFCLALLCCALIFVLLACSAGVAPINVDADNIVIKGYDPVAYFTMGHPVKGKKEYQLEWHGAKWLFSSQENRAMFQENPEKYAPRYGGYCAYAVSRGTTADIDPDSWAIVDGKLYLNLNKSVQNLWNQDRQGYIQKADRNWPQLLGR
jgi:YHS domain-containing protein